MSRYGGWQYIRPPLFPSAGGVFGTNFAVTHSYVTISPNHHDCIVNILAKQYRRKFWPDSGLHFALLHQDCDTVRSSYCWIPVGIVLLPQLMQFQCYSAFSF